MPDKRLGQNFLINEPVVKSIIEAADLRDDDVVLEIGSGTGIVTRELAARVQEVFACEFSRGLMTALQDELKEFSNIRYIQADALTIDIKQLASGGKLKVVANLPYYITTPIITMLLEAKEHISLIILMMQHEVGMRILSEPDNYHAAGSKGTYLSDNTYDAA